MAERILFVDDDPNILRSYKRNLSFDFDIHTAEGGEIGLQMLSNEGPYAVVVSDMRMPNMNGTQFLSKVRQVWPDTVRILLTGQSDLSDAISVINRGQIFRFLTKPCPPEAFAQALQEGVSLHKAITSEKELLNQTLKGSVKLLMDVLSMVSPNAYSRSRQVRDLASKIARRLGLKNLWQLELTVLLSRIGYVTVPPVILDKRSKGKLLSEIEKKHYYRYLENGSNLVKNIPRLQEIAAAILYQEKRFDGGGPPYDDTEGKRIPLLARILKIVYDYDELLTKEGSDEQAYKRLIRQKGWYDPEIFEAMKLELLLTNNTQVIEDIRPRDIQTGSVVAADVVTRDNILILAKNQEVSETVRLCILDYAERGEIAGLIKVFK